MHTDIVEGRAVFWSFLCRDRFMSTTGWIYYHSASHLHLTLVRLLITFVPDSLKSWRSSEATPRHQHPVYLRVRVLYAQSIRYTHQPSPAELTRECALPCICLLVSSQHFRLWRQLHSIHSRKSAVTFVSYLLHNHRRTSSLSHDFRRSRVHVFRRLNGGSIRAKRQKNNKAPPTRETLENPPIWSLISTGIQGVQYTNE